MEDYSDTAAVLEMRVNAASNDTALDVLLPTRMPECALTILRRAEPNGRVHAVRHAKQHFGDERFAFLLLDDLIKGKSGALSQMVQARSEVGGHLVATKDMPLKDTSAYGVLDVVFENGRVARARGMVKKRRPKLAPSTKDLFGRYILRPGIFGRLDNLGLDAGGGRQLTDAINADVNSVGGYGYRFAGKWYDCGSTQGFVQATAAFALDGPVLAPEFSDFLAQRLTAPAKAA